MVRTSAYGLASISAIYANNLYADIRYGMNKGHPTTAIPKVQKPSQRKGGLSTKTKFVRSVVREVAGFSPYERRVMELLRNSKVSPKRRCRSGC
jgi:hypothetical protein